MLFVCLYSRLFYSVQRRGRYRAVLQQGSELALVEGHGPRLVRAQRADGFSEPWRKVAECGHRRPFGNTGLALRQPYTVCGLYLPRRVFVAGLRAFLYPCAVESEVVPVNVTTLVEGHSLHLFLNP